MSVITKGKTEYLYAIFGNDDWHAIGGGMAITITLCQKNSAV